MEDEAEGERVGVDREKGQGLQRPKDDRDAGAQIQAGEGQVEGNDGAVESTRQLEVVDANAAIDLNLEEVVLSQSAAHPLMLQANGLSTQIDFSQLLGMPQELEQSQASVNVGAAQPNVDLNLMIQNLVGQLPPGDASSSLAMAAAVDPAITPMLQPLAPGNALAAETMTAEPVAPPKKSKREKSFLHFNLVDFYDLRKVKYTLVIDELQKKKLERSQFIYTLDLKDEPTMKYIEAAIEDGHKRLYIDLGVHIKQMQVREVAILSQEEGSASSPNSKARYTKKTRVKMPEEAQVYGTMPSLGTFKAPVGYPEAICKQRQLKSWYLSPEKQARFFEQSFRAEREITGTDDISKDLNSVDYYQRDFQYYTEQNVNPAGRSEPGAGGEDALGQRILGKKPELHIAKFLTLKLRKQTASEVIKEQLRKVLKIVISLGQVKVEEESSQVGRGLCGQAEPLTDFGIRAIDYRLRESRNAPYATSSSKLPEARRQSTGTYILTSDDFEASQLWMPQIYGATRKPVGWSMNYLVPKEAQVVSAGEFVRRKDLKDGQGVEKTLHVYKAKRVKREKTCPPEQAEEVLKQTEVPGSEEGGLLPGKVGFVIGDFPYLSQLQTSVQPIGRQKMPESTMGVAFFSSSTVKAVFEAEGFYCNQICAALDSIEVVLKRRHPARASGQDRSNRNHLKILFLPNLFTSKQQKQSIDFADNIHIFDEQILLPRNLIEKRHRIYKILATGLAHSFFGDLTWEDSPEDAWLLVSLRERMGDRFKRMKCGQNLYRYHMIKTAEKFFDAVKAGAERYALTSQFVSHFSELEHGQDVYRWKCQLIMHIIETMLGEAHFCNVVRELFERSKPTMSLQSFKRILRDLGIRFQDLQKNWIESTSAPEIYCMQEFNKKSHQISITVEQHSAVKVGFMLQQLVAANKNQISHGICANGRLLSKSLEEEMLKVSAKQAEATSAATSSQIKSASGENEQRFFVEVQRNSKRWFNADIKVDIYLTDGAEIFRQTQKIKLKYPKTRVQCNVPLGHRIRKGIDRKKRDVNQAILENLNCVSKTDEQLKGVQANEEDEEDQEHAEQVHRSQFKYGNYGLIGSKLAERVGLSSRQIAEQLHQIQSDNAQWRFGLTDEELEEYPARGTSRLFEVRNIDCPVLWLRVDPQLETIRRVKVCQSRKSWLFQLLQERDFIGQIEACKELKNYRDEFVYEILKSVVKSDRYFFKVRKHALRSLQEMNVSCFDEYLSHEKAFLVSYFNQRNFNERIGFYHSNDFRNVLEYYINSYLIQALATSKERKLTIKEDAERLYNMSLATQQNQLACRLDVREGGKGSETNGGALFAMINFSAAGKSDQDTEMDDTGAKVGERLSGTGAQGRKDAFDMRELSITSDLIASLLLRLLQENDNSENPFDDSFHISKILANLGKLDNFDCMPSIAAEIEKYLRLDRLGQRSTLLSISKGCIKSYFNMRKQIYRYKQFKRPYLDETKCRQEMLRYERQIVLTEKTLDRLASDFRSIQRDGLMSMELRVFIFEKHIKNLFRFNSDFIDESSKPREESFDRQSGQLDPSRNVSGIIDSYRRKENQKKATQQAIPLNSRTSVAPKFLNPLYFILKEVEDSLRVHDYRFGAAQLEALALFLEKNFLSRLNFKECLYSNDAKCKVIAQKLIYLMTVQPITILDRRMSQWAKRVYNCIFLGSNVPLCLEYEQGLKAITQPFKTIAYDWIWSEPEEEQQKRADEHEMKKQQAAGQKNKKSNEAGNPAGDTEQQQRVSCQQSFEQNSTLNTNQIDLAALAGLAAGVAEPNSRALTNPFSPMDGALQMLPPLAPQQDGGIPLQGADQAALSAHIAALAGLPAGSAINMDLLMNMSMAPLAQGGNPRLFGPLDGSLQHSQDNSTLIQIQNILDKADRRQAASGGMLGLGSERPFQMEEGAVADQQSSSIIRFNILERSDGMMMAASENDVGEAGNGMPEFLGNGDAANMIVSLDGGSRRLLRERDQLIDEEEDYRYGAGEDDEDDVPQGHNEVCYRGHSDLVAEQPVELEEDDDGYRDMSSSDANLRYNYQQDEPYDRTTYDEWQKQKDFARAGEAEQLASQYQQTAAGIEIQEEVYDFDDYSFEELWKQKCWDTLHLLYYNVDAGPFLDEISRKTLGDAFDDYLAVIGAPITLPMIKEKCKSHAYANPQQFVGDMRLVFDNCMRFNEVGSSFHTAARKLKRILDKEVKKKRLTKCGRKFKHSQQRMMDEDD